MAEGTYQIKNQAEIHFMTFTIMGWMDIFSRQVYRDKAIESLNFCRRNKGLLIHAYVIMTNHIHAILSARQSNLSDVIRDFKTLASKEILQTIETETESRREWLLYMFRYFGEKQVRNNTYQVWMQENHAEELLTNRSIDQKLNYIHENPVRAGIVEEPEHYLYSSARDYAGEKGLLPLSLLK